MCSLLAIAGRLGLLVALELLQLLYLFLASPLALLLPPPLSILGLFPLLLRLGLLLLLAPPLLLHLLLPLLLLLDLLLQPGLLPCSLALLLRTLL